MGKLLDALKAQGVEITEEVEKAVMTGFVEKATADLKDVEIKELADQITKRDADITKLKETDPDLKKQFEELEAKYSQENKNLSEKLTDAELTGELKLALNSAKAKDVDLALGLIDKSQITRDKDGKWTGINEAVEQVKNNKAFIFDSGPAADPKPGYEYRPGSADAPETKTGNLGDAIAERLGLE